MSSYTAYVTPNRVDIHAWLFRDVITETTITIDHPPKTPAGQTPVFDNTSNAGVQ